MENIKLIFNPWRMFLIKPWCFFLFIISLPFAQIYTDIFLVTSMVSDLFNILTLFLSMTNIFNKTITFVLEGVTYLNSNIENEFTNDWYQVPSQ